MLHVLGKRKQILGCITPTIYHLV